MTMMDARASVVCVHEMYTERATRDEARGYLVDSRNTSTGSHELADVSACVFRIRRFTR